MAEAQGIGHRREVVSAAEAHAARAAEAGVGGAGERGACGAGRRRIDAQVTRAEEAAAAA